MVSINTDFYKEEYDEHFLDVERVIRGYIFAEDGENLDNIVKCDPRDEVFMQLSSLRKSTVSWYPFKKDATVLEIEGGFGALTGVLCDCCRYVTVTEPSLLKVSALAKRYKSRENLKIYAGSIEDIILTEQFDYIILCGVLEKVGKGSKEKTAYAQYIKNLIRYLKDDGKILTAVDNLYSLLRWDGRKNYEQTNGNCIWFFHKKQLQDIMEEAGLICQKFYYPMPDYRIVGSVYTDECPPTAEDWKRLGGCYQANVLPSQESVETLDNLIKNGTFSFWANSFFLEAGRIANQTELESILVLSERESCFEHKERKAIEKYTKDSILEQLKLEPIVLECDQDKKQLEKVMEVQLDLLRYLKEVCDKHQLKLYMMYGTLLGAVRHGGIIPGDDDIDVALSREDFNKLLELKDEFKGKYFLQTPWNDNCFYGGYLKLCNKNTTAIKPQNWWIDCCEGISIDIFPLDNGYDNQYLQKWKEISICFWQRLLFAKAYGYFSKFKDMELLEWKFYKYLGKPFKREWLADRLHKIMEKGDCKQGSPYGIFAHYTQGKWYRQLDRRAFERSVDLLYEDILLAAPERRYDVLQMLYGIDYMTPLPWQEWKRRHGFYRADVPYQIYKKRLSGLMNPAPVDKEIVLFGDGLLFESYFQRYKDKYIPKHIVLVEEERNIKSINGIKVEKFKEFKPNDKSKIYAVICSIDIARAEKILQQADYREYYIFVHNRDWLLLANPSWALREFRGN